MNRMLMSLLPLVAVACAGAQAPTAANTLTENSKVSRFVAGPGNRPQGALLRNGTFVTFSPGLAQQLPASLSKNVSLQVVGEGFSYAGSRTIQARSITIAGVSYNDDMPMPGNPGVGLGGPGSGHPPAPAPGMPPAPPAGRGGLPPPRPGARNSPPPPPAGAPPAGVPGAPPPPVATTQATPPTAGPAQQ